MSLKKLASLLKSITKTYNYYMTTTGMLAGTAFSPCFLVLSQSSNSEVIRPILARASLTKKVDLAFVFRLPRTRRNPIFSRYSSSIHFQLSYFFNLERGHNISDFAFHKGANLSNPLQAWCMPENHLVFVGTILLFMETKASSCARTT